MSGRTRSMRKGIKAVVVTCILVMGMLLCMAGTAFADTMYAKVTVNVRTAPNMSGQVYAWLTAGNSIDTVGETNGWYQVNYKGRTGYIYGVNLASSSTGATTMYAKVTVNVRTAPSMSGQVYAWLTAGSSIDTVGETNGWYQVNYKGRTGYIYGVNLAASGSGSATATTMYAIGNVYIRSGATTNSKALGVLKTGASIMTYGATGKWYQVSYNGQTGYVSGKYLSLTPGGSPVYTG